jgi:hypothetical protein
MNPSANSNEQQGDPSWATENWDNPGAVGSLDQGSRQYTGASRLEWDWDPAMILAQHPGGSGSNDGSDGDRKNQITAGESLRVQSLNWSLWFVATSHGCFSQLYPLTVFLDRQDHHLICFWAP